MGGAGYTQLTDAIVPEAPPVGNGVLGRADGVVEEFRVQFKHCKGS